MAARLKLRSLLSRPWAVVVALGVGHLLVDASSNFVLGSTLPYAPVSDLLLIYLAYNFFAFALQPLVGLATDRWQAPRAVLVSGALVSALALVPVPCPLWLPVLATAVGNALFHVGAGSVVALATPRSAQGSGLFIAPGAIGVLLGALAGWKRVPIALPFFVALVGVALLGTLLPSRWPGQASLPVARLGESVRPRVLVGLILLLSIALRTLLGLRVAAQIGPELGWVVAATLAAFAGQAIGGVLADRWGWTRLAVPALVASSILLLAARSGVVFALPAILAFQTVTAVTLTGLYHLWPKRIATCFGLACFAIFLGALPVLLQVRLFPSWGIAVDAGLCALSAIAVWVALKGWAPGPSRRHKSCLQSGPTPQSSPG